MTKRPAKRTAPTIVEEKGVFSIPSLESNGGNPVESHSRRFMESIAHEFLDKGKLDAHDFGPYSIYSTYRDSIAGEPFVNEVLVNQLIDTDHVQVESDCGCVWSMASEHLGPAYLELCGQLGVFEAANPYSVIYRESLERHLESIPDYEKTVFCLLNGMFRVPISVAMLFLNEALSLNDLHSYMEQPMTTGSQITEATRGRSFGHHMNPDIEHIGAFLDHMRQAESI